MWSLPLEFLVGELKEGQKDRPELEIVGQRQEKDPIRGRLSCSAGVSSLLSAAADDGPDDPPDDRVEYYLRGDLDMMVTQQSFLAQRKFATGMSNIYPVLYSEEDFNQAVMLFWEHRVRGWWFYEEELVKLGVCTEEEYKKALSQQCVVTREEHERSKGR